MALDEAKLGCATTKELLEELSARGTVGRSSGSCVICHGLMIEMCGHMLESLSPTILDYRTVDGRIEPGHGH